MTTDESLNAEELLELARDMTDAEKRRYQPTFPNDCVIRPFPATVSDLTPPVSERSGAELLVC